MFPISLAPEFKAAIASSFVPQPEWYFLWLYQVLKFSTFEGAGIQFVLGGATILLLFVVLLPFLDRGRERDPASRPVFVTVGVIAVAEIVALTIWGYLTPGRVIPDWEALTFCAGIAGVVGILTWITFRARRTFQARNLRGRSELNSERAKTTSRELNRKTSPDMRRGATSP